MAVTKIWTIKDSLQRVLDYAANPDKTEYDALAQTLHYAENDAKTKLNESAQLVTGIHCRADHAWEDMRAVQERFGKTDGVVALHAYQSFREGEVTPEQCHEIGVALARKVWGKRFQVLVATHMNTDNLHNHFVINSVSYVDGKKYEQRRSQYAEFRETSDKLCREYGLSVVEQPKAKEPARYARMREAIDQACEDLPQMPISSAIRLPLPTAPLVQTRISLLEFPPKTGRSVTRTTLHPFCATARAAHTPAGPPPITATSTLQQTICLAFFTNLHRPVRIFTEYRQSSCASLLYRRHYHLFIFNNAAAFV